MARNNNEAVLGNYVAANEGQAQEPTAVVEAQPIPGLNQIGYQKTDKALKIEREVNNIGWHRIDVKTLPTGGLFYPDEIELWIKSATGEEIKHWSTMDETEIMDINGAWNYIIERCVSVKTNRGGNWRDLKDVDRLYLLLAVRELTFIDDDNNLMVPIAEGKNIPVSKEMIHYIDIPEDIMRYYSSAEKCFIFNIKNANEVRIYIPSIGMNDWIVNYIHRKRQQQQGIDEDFAKYAPLLIPDYRSLTESTYEQYVMNSRNYGKKEWSVISYVVDTLKKVLMPTFKYTREDGADVEVPISFLGGHKAIFTISNPLSVLC